MFKFAPLVPEDGVIVYNSSLIDEVPENLSAKTLAIPATDLAKELGNVKAANTVILGHLAAQTGLFTLDDWRALLKDSFPKEKLYQLNVAAIEKGFSFGE